MRAGLGADLWSNRRAAPDTWSKTGESASGILDRRFEICVPFYGALSELNGLVIRWVFGRTFVLYLQTEYCYKIVIGRFLRNLGNSETSLNLFMPEDFHEPYYIALCYTKVRHNFLKSCLHVIK